MNDDKSIKTKEVKNMTRKHIVARNAKEARKKGTSKRRVVTKVNYIKGSKKGSKKTYDVTTRERKK